MWLASFQRFSNTRLRYYASGKVNPKLDAVTRSPEEIVESLFDRILKNEKMDLQSSIPQLSQKCGTPFAADVLHKIVKKASQEKPEALSKAAAMLDAHHTTPVHLAPLLEHLASRSSDTERELLANLFFHLVKNKDRIQIRNMLASLTRQWVPTFTIELDSNDIFWVDYSMWMREATEDADGEKGLDSVFYGTLIGSLFETKETHDAGVQFMVDITRKWVQEAKSPRDKQVDPINGIYFGLSVFANYIGHITRYGEAQEQPKDAKSSPIISNERVADLSHDFVGKILGAFRGPLGLSNLDMIGMLSITIAETSCSRGRRWHDLDLINKMIDATVSTVGDEGSKTKGFIDRFLPASLQKPERKKTGIVKLTDQEQKLLNRLISRKFRLWKAVKDVFPKWGE